MQARRLVPVVALVIGAACLHDINAVDADPILEPTSPLFVPLPKSSSGATRPTAVAPTGLPLLSPLSPLAGVAGVVRWAPDPAAIWIRWDDYRTLVVIGPVGGRELPAWVATYDATTGKLAVAYRATARLEADGSVRVDAHSAVISGPQAWQWSPDSFVIGVDRLVNTSDDEPTHPGNHGDIEKTVDPSREPALYRQLLQEVQAQVGGGT